jgi:hypothetical protein
VADQHVRIQIDHRDVETARAGDPRPAERNRWTPHASPSDAVMIWRPSSGR